MSCGFKLVAEPILPELSENYIMVFAPEEINNAAVGAGWATLRKAPAARKVSKLPAGFVYLQDVDASIRVCLRYNSQENFLGTVVEGYRSNTAIMTVQAADALKEVQRDVQKDGYSLLVYDSFRPQRAVNHFVRWSEAKDNNCDLKKAEYFPDIDRAELFERGYIARKSGHSRGSTVDLTLIAHEQQVNCSPAYSVRAFQSENGVISVPYLDDNSVDMGTSFDLLGEASHINCSYIPPAAQAMRNYLQDVMLKHGFVGYSQEWWHFTLRDEPFPDTYFDFPIE